MKSWKRFAGVCLILGFVSGINLGINKNSNLVFLTSANAETSGQYWLPLNDNNNNNAKILVEKNASKKVTSHSYENAKIMKLDHDLIRENLGFDRIQAWGTQASQAKTTQISEQFNINLPLPNGTLIEVSVVTDSVLPAILAVKYPDIKTFRVLANDSVFSGKIDMSNAGFHAMLQMLDGEIIFIDPVQSNQSHYAVFKKSAQKTDDDRQHSCGANIDSKAVNDFDIQSQLSSPITSARNLNLKGNESERSTESLKNYTIAIATTGEYSAKFGGSVGATLAAITMTLSRVNQILERDLGIHLSLVENNDLLINTNALSDPFTETKLIDLVFQNQDYIDAIIGNANYDLGHLFTASGGGLAAIASVCNSNDKAKAASGITSPRGDSFDLDFVAHEIGHQLGATHTFNSTEGACSIETRTARTAFEPGSGSSIMSYAGYCGIDNIQSNTDAMYHIGSIKQIADYTNYGTGSQCGVVTASQNTPPEVDAGKNYTIPTRTPFELSGSAVDEDGDPLLFAWEQLDAGDASTESADSGNNALFRVHAPSASKSRSFPPLLNVLNNTAAKGETLPEFQRSLTLGFIAQDGFNVTQSDEMTINVERTGSRFALHYPRAHYARGNTYPIFWNTANTDKSPVNCTSVNIWLSVDGGKIFNQAVANNISNNGETFITIPPDTPVSSQGRFKIKCSDNIFYAISQRNFIVTKNDSTLMLEYANEDQAETNLKDTLLNSSSATSNSSVNNTTNVVSVNSGGGVFDRIFCLFLLLLIFSKRLVNSRVTGNKRTCINNCLFV